jgi:secondary thiamine-phosphate synthase enzyme
MLDFDAALQAPPLDWCPSGGSVTIYAGHFKGRDTMETFSVRSRQRNALIDITDQVQDALAKIGISAGICTVYVPHTTAGILINEGADPSVCRDILNRLGELVPEGGDYRHMEGNADSHIKVAAVGSSETVLVEDGRLRLGRWQHIFFAEFDGPRNRNVWVQAVGR